MTPLEQNAGAVTDLAEGAMRELTRGDQKILLARVGGFCHAIDGTCPHAGASLARGVLRDGVVICPWHKAAFRLDSGACVEPPAVDGLRRYPVRIADGRILVSLDGEMPEPAKDDGSNKCIVIVGAGAAGAAAAQTLREAGFGGRIILIGREDRLPYDRTLLSKYALSGKQGGEKSPLQDDGFYKRARIERLPADVRWVDPAARELTFSDETTLAFDAALVATGGIPRRPKLPGADLAGVFSLRAPGDADAIVSAAGNARRAVVIGAGFIAMEVAASLRERGLGVTVAAPQTAPFERQLGPEIGGAFRRLHERQGVAFRLGHTAAAIEGDESGNVRAVRLDDGSMLPADFVVAGLGIKPATSILRGTELRDDGGVNVDGNLRVAGAVFAAGDIAAFPLRGDGARIRVEHWRVAQQHGRVAALNMLGKSTVYDAVPYFWTIQYLKRLDYVGHAEQWDSIVIDGDLDKPEFVAFYLRDEKVAAVAGWDRDKQMAAVIGLMAERRDWPVGELRIVLRGIV